MYGKFFTGTGVIRRFAVLFCCAVCTAAGFDVPKAAGDDPAKAPLVVSPAEHEELFGARIQRTMTLLATSTESCRNPVKILFYGQSITEQNWTEMVTDELRNRFPYADITIENRAIGGFTAPALVRTSVHDLYPFYPDLTVFHVYGGETTGELERIISNIRRYTTSEILVSTHHIAQFHDLGTAEYLKRHRQDDESAQVMRYLAQKYDCELVEIRGEWARYLDDNGLEPRVLLQDGIHLNDQGNRLMAALVARHFRYTTLFHGGWAGMVRTYEACRLSDEGKHDEIVFTGEPWKMNSNTVIGYSPDSALRLEFDGNRVDIIGGPAPGEMLGSARILIDGTAPSNFPGTREFTRPSKAYGTWMPAIRRIDHRGKLVDQDWTLKITSITDDAGEFAFEVTGSVTGYDGSGTNAELFVSDSGQVLIDPRDFMITWVQGYFKKKCPAGFEVTWGVQTLCTDIYKPRPVEDDSRPAIVTVAQGLPNGRHLLEIVPEGDGAVPIRAVKIHTPPLR